MTATPPDHDQPVLRGEDSPSSYDAPVYDDLGVVTPGHARFVAQGFAMSRDRIHRQIAAQVSSGDVTGLDGPIHAARRYDTLAELWGTYGDEGATTAALTAGRMIYRAVERAEIDTARLEAARNFLGDVHEQHTAHAQVVRCITHGIA